MNRGKRLALNSVSSLLLQIITIISGFVLPRLILANYGSEVNGLVTSITQFLAFISFLEFGVGAVVQSALYKPLAYHDDAGASRILASANKFFNRLAGILLGYVILLIVFYPLMSHSEFSFFYIAALLIAISINSFAQYFFGIIDSLLLSADQRGYIQNAAQGTVVVFNTIACIVLIKLGASIQIVKFTSSLLFLIRPLFLRWYVNKHYNINRRIQYDSEPIPQKWNGVAQHIAAVVLANTDTIILTIMSSLSNVSIYGVYHMVLNGINTLFTSMVSGLQSLLGELWAKQETEELNTTFSRAEWLLHNGVLFTFGCASSLIVPFVMVYTTGVNDANYEVPLFALLITLSNAVYCLRLPYNIMILAGGHYKQTQHIFIIAASLNIVVSVASVKLFGLIGVAIGTLAAMIYQTIAMAWHDAKVFIKSPFLAFIKQLVVDAVAFFIGYMICRLLPFDEPTVFNWIILALECALIWGSITLAANLIFYRSYLINAFHKAIHMIRRER